MADGVERPWNSYLAQAHALRVSATRRVLTDDIVALTVTSMNFAGSNYVLRGASTITVGSSLINVLCNGDSNVIESALHLPGAFAVAGSKPTTEKVATTGGRLVAGDSAARPDRTPATSVIHEMRRTVLWARVFVA